jgi:hypothetical protein
MATPPRRKAAKGKLREIESPPLQNYSSADSAGRAAYRRHVLRHGDTPATRVEANERNRIVRRAWMVWDGSGGTRDQGDDTPPPTKRQAFFQERMAELRSKDDTPPKEAFRLCLAEWHQHVREEGRLAAAREAAAYEVESMLAAHAQPLAGIGAAEAGQKAKLNKRKGGPLPVKAGQKRIRTKTSVGAPAAEHVNAGAGATQASERPQLRGGVGKDDDTDPPAVPLLSSAGGQPDPPQEQRVADSDQPLAVIAEPLADTQPPSDMDEPRADTDQPRADTDQPLAVVPAVAPGDQPLAVVPAVAPGDQPLAVDPAVDPDEDFDSLLG